VSDFSSTNNQTHDNKEKKTYEHRTLIMLTYRTHDAANDKTKHTQNAQNLTTTDEICDPE